MSWYDDLVNNTRSKLGVYGDGIQDTAATIGNGLLAGAASAGGLADMLLGGGGPSAQLALVNKQIADNGFKYSGHDWGADLNSLIGSDPRIVGAKQALRVAAPVLQDAANTTWDSLSPTAKAGLAGAGSLGLLGLNLMGPWAPEADAALSAEHGLAQSKGILGAIGGGKKGKAITEAEKAAADDLLSAPAANAAAIDPHQNYTNWQNAPLASADVPALNVGLNVGDVEKLTPQDVVSKIEKIPGVKVLGGHVERSGTENTYVPTLNRPLTNKELHDLSVATDQEAIAQRTGEGIGDLAGPKAHLPTWGGAYNDTYFIRPRVTPPSVTQIPGYPKIGDPVMTFDKPKGVWYWAKGQSDDGKSVMAARAAAQKQIDAGNYNPYFDVSARKHVDSSAFPLTSDPTVDSAAKQQKTMDKHRAVIDTPENYARLESAFLEGMKNPDNKDWYAMGQLHDKYRSVFSEAGKSQEEADSAFKRDFAQMMANTTGGADPTANLLQSHFANYTHALGMDAPNRGYAMPNPIGGRYVGGNMDVANASRGLLEPSSADQPKRNSFMRNFLGHLESPTIDEQMTNAITPGKNAPATGQYPIYADMVKRIADQYGIAPATAQEIIWGGAKTSKGGGYVGKPMIQHYNEAIERTSKVLGLTPEQTIRGIILKQIPMYGFGGLALGGGLLSNRMLSGNDGT